MLLGSDLLGHCPDCDAAIPTRSVVVEYREPGEWPATIAACPDCDALVHPT